MNNIIVNSEIAEPLEEAYVSVVSLGGLGASAVEQESPLALASSAFIRVHLRFHWDDCGVCASAASWEFAAKRIVYQTALLIANRGIRTGRNSLKINDAATL